MAGIDTVLGVVGSVTAPSKTRTAVEVALDAAGDAFDLNTRVVHLAEYDLTTADGRSLDEYRGDTATVLEAVVESDAYVIGTPVYRASYSGALKNLFDMIPRGKWQADVAPLANSAVGLLATGASPHHFLAIDNELRPLMAFFGAHPVGGSVYAYDEHFEDDRIVDADVETRLETLGLATVELGEAIESSKSLSELGPQI